MRPASMQAAELDFTRRAQFLHSRRILCPPRLLQVASPPPLQAPVLYAQAGPAQGRLGLSLWGMAV